MTFPKHNGLRLVISKKRMTRQEAQSAIDAIPLGATLELVKTNGDIIQVKLMSKDLSAIEAKDYGAVTVPQLPPALTVVGGTRFGKYRIELSELVSIARVG